MFEKVKQTLALQGINVYYIHTEVDKDGFPYFVYTFDEKLVEEAKKNFANGFIGNGIFDDYSTDDYDFEKDITIIIALRYNNL